MISGELQPITEEWLRASGFKFSQKIAGGNDKHWILWLADACVDCEQRAMVSREDLGIELATWGVYWHCWIRADYSGLYSRFVHIRHMAFQNEVVGLIEAMTGRAFKPEDCMYGSFHCPVTADRLRKESQRLDHRLAREWGGRVDKELGIDPDDRKLRTP